MFNIISCSMILKEVAFVLKEIGLENEFAFFNPGSHEFEYVERSLTEQLEKIKEKNNKPILVVIGQTCHPDISSILDRHSAVGLNTGNCFEALLGSEKERLDKESTNFYITSLWFEYWEDIFKIIGWTEVDARIKIGFCDRVILLDTGLTEITDEKILKLFDFIQVPIEIKKVDLGHLKSLIIEAIKRAKGSHIYEVMHDPAPQAARTGKLQELVQMALQIGAGAIDMVAVSPSDISAEDDLANHCREPRCPYYGLSANCPPHVLGPSGFRDLLKTYEHALAVKIDIPMGCLFTDERNEIFKLLHEIVADIEKAAVELGYANSKAFAAGSCKVIFCHEHGSCRVIDGGECRNPQYARPSMEANGINVCELNKTAGWSMKRDTNEADTDRLSMGAVYGLVLVG